MPIVPDAQWVERLSDTRDDQRVTGDSRQRLEGSRPTATRGTYAAKVISVGVDGEPVVAVRDDTVMIFAGFLQGVHVDHGHLQISQVV